MAPEQLWEWFGLLTLVTCVVGLLVTIIRELFRNPRLAPDQVENSLYAKYRSEYENELWKLHTRLSFEEQWRESAEERVQDLTERLHYLERHCMDHSQRR